jgi:flagellar biosynthesis/type III secretory pathway protein FliH
MTSFVPVPQTEKVQEVVCMTLAELNAKLEQSKREGYSAGYSIGFEDAVEEFSKFGA